MTREEMATRLEDIGRLAKRVNLAGTNGDVLIAAAVAELRKTCAGCKHWREVYCLKGFDMLFDGTGFCSHWEVK